MSAETRLIESAIAYLGRRLGPRCVLKAIRLDIVGMDGVRQEVKLKPTGLGQSTDDEEGAAATPIRRAVLEVLAEAEGPLKGQAIARRAGRSYSGSFRANLAAMVRDGLLLLVGEGYELADGGQDEQDS